MIAAVASSAGARKGFSTGQAEPSAGAGWDSSGRVADANSIVPSPLGTGFDQVSVGSDQRLHGCNVLVDPIDGLVSRLELAEVAA
jgi:hypothetical protein